MIREWLRINNFLIETTPTASSTSISLKATADRRTSKITFSGNQIYMAVVLFGGPLAIIIINLKGLIWKLVNVAL